MPNINDMRDSKFLRRADVGAGKLLTILRCDQQNVAMENEAPDLKYVLHFVEEKKGMVLNSTNAQLIAKALGSDESDDWLGKQIVCYDDPNVSFAGKLVGGIRCRAKKNQVTATATFQSPANTQQRAATPPPVNAAETADESGLPF